MASTTNIICHHGNCHDHSPPPEKQANNCITTTTMATTTSSASMTTTNPTIAAPCVMDVSKNLQVTMPCSSI